MIGHIHCETTEQMMVVIDELIERGRGFEVTPGPGTYAWLVKVIL